MNNTVEIMTDRIICLIKRVTCCNYNGNHTCMYSHFPPSDSFDVFLTNVKVVFYAKGGETGRGFALEYAEGSSSMQMTETDTSIPK